MKLRVLLQVVAILLLTASASAPSPSHQIYLPLVTSKLQPIIPQTTVVLSAATTSHLESLSSTGIMTFTQSTEELTHVVPGDVIVSAPTAVAPYGFLRKVTAVSHLQNQTVFQTVRAALTDAIQQGSISVDQELSTTMNGNVALLLSPCKFNVDMISLVMFDADKDVSTPDDQVRVHGSVKLINPRIHFDLSIRNGKVERLVSTVSVDEVADLHLEAVHEWFPTNVEKELVKCELPPIEFLVGVVPVMITPTMAIVVGADIGKPSVGVSVGVTQQAQVESGAQYDRNGWTPIANATNQFQFSPPSLAADVSAKLYASPKFGLLLYDVVGPSFRYGAYLNLVADQHVVSLYGGLDGEISIDVEMIDGGLIVYTKSIEFTKQLLWSHPIDATPTPTSPPPPTMTPTPSPTATPTPILASGEIVFTSERDPSCSIKGLYSMNGNGSNQHPVLCGLYPSWPKWSPDGTKIAFNLNDDDVAVINVDGSGYINLSHDHASTSPSWSPDGRKIAFQSTSQSGSTINVINTDGTNRISLNVPGSSPTWSPDGQYIAYTTSSGGANQLAVMTSSGASVFSGACGFSSVHMSWFPDSKHILTTCYGILVVVDLSGAEGELPGSCDSFPRVSPDGRHIAFAECDSQGNPTVVVADPSGSNRVVTLMGSDTTDIVEWAPDSVRLLINRGGSPATIWTVAIDGSDLSPLATTGVDGESQWH